MATPEEQRTRDIQGIVARIATRMESHEPVIYNADITFSRALSEVEAPAALIELAACIGWTVIRKERERGT